MKAIYKRELRSYFTSPIGYVFVAVYLVLSGVLFAYTTLLTAISGGSADIGTYFTVLIFGFSFLLPLLTMRLFADDRRMKTEQLLLTAPVSIGGMVGAKFLAAYTVFAGTYAVSALDFLLLYIYNDTSGVVTEKNTAILVGYSIAVLLLGAAFIAVGVFVSSLTEHQITAVIATIAILVFCLCCGMLNSVISFAPLRSVLSWLSIYSRFQNFSYGVFDFNAIIYYLSITFVFLFVTVRVYEKRRWA
mgnify:FL=1